MVRAMAQITVNKTRVYITTHGVTTTRDMPDEAVTQFIKDHRREYELKNHCLCPATFRREKLIKRRV